MSLIQIQKRTEPQRWSLGQFVKDSIGRCANNKLNYGVQFVRVRKTWAQTVTWAQFPTLAFSLGVVSEVRRMLNRRLDGSA